LPAGRSSSAAGRPKQQRSRLPGAASSRVGLVDGQREGKRDDTVGRVLVQGAAEFRLQNEPPCRVLGLGFIVPKRLGQHALQHVVGLAKGEVLHPGAFWRWPL
jgi:hypothetical protein